VRGPESKAWLGLRSGALPAAGVCRAAVFSAHLCRTPSRAAPHPGPASPNGSPVAGDPRQPRRAPSL